MVNYQWKIFRADLDPVRGSEQAGFRPVLVISSEEVNQHLPIITVVSLTTVKQGRKVYPIEAYLSKEESGLPKDSIVMAHQIRAVAKDRLGEKYGEIKNHEIKEKIRNAVRVYLDL
ncbi:MAG TPA: type II toxin-antitoxin system PemK/MazF family toxin [Anaerovoracaceae bacterium]|nr:type II toxin-antitoxin system PemK/MazF family toxin [Anaerovoracaceae bacterium]